MSDLALIPVPAFYLDRATGRLTQANILNRLAAEDFAPKWNSWRDQVRRQYGWELLISPPAAGTDYTRAFFRTPEDQAALYAANPQLATAADRGAHQAGRAVDLDLQGMAATYSNYSYEALAAAAKQNGIYNRIADTEPWHFDDDPATLFGDARRAIEAIGNLTDQVAAALKAGLDSPQVAAAKAFLAAQSATTWLWLGLAAGVIYFTSRPRPRPVKAGA